MATNNAVNQQQPVPSWFVYLNTTVNNVTGAAADYTIAYDTTLYAIGGVTHLAGVVTVPLSGYYLLSSGIKVGGLTSSHTAFNLTSGSVAGARYYLGSPAKIKVGDKLSCTSNVFVYIAAGATAITSVYCAPGTKVVDVIGAAAPNYVTWFSGKLLHI